MTANGTRVSVVVPCRNEARHIAGLLDAIKVQSHPVSEVVVVDSSSDRTADAVLSYGRRNPSLPVTVVSVEKASIPAAVNAGVAKATGEIIVRLDGHCIPAADYVARAVAALDGGADIGVAGGVWNISPGAKTLTAEAIARAGSHPAGAGDAAYRIAQATTTRQDVDTVPFGCFRKTLWTELGGLNEALLTNEDYEFNFRVRASGRRVVLDPAIRSTYFARPTLGSLAQQYFRYGWWKLAMLRRHPSSIRWRQALPAALVAAFLVLFVLSVFSPVARLALAGLAAVYTTMLTLAAAHASSTARRWPLLPALVAAFAVIHLCWGFGANVNLVTGGRWPFRSGDA